MAPLLRNKGAGATLFDLPSSSFAQSGQPASLTLLGHKVQTSEHLGRLGCQVNGNPLHSSGTARLSVSAFLEVVCAEDED